MKKCQATPAAEAITELIPDIFRVSGLLVTEGDRLVAKLGLTSSRWQVLGAIVGADRPQPVAWLARDLGANRQNIQRIVNDMRNDGLVRFDVNPHHRRAQFVLLTEKGSTAFRDAMTLQLPWVEGIARGLAIEDIATAQRVIATLRKNMKSDPTAATPNVA